MEQKEAIAKAKEVNDISLDYHLSHAVLACDRLLEDAFKKEGMKKTEEIKKNLEKAYKENNTEKLKELLEKKDALTLEKYHIFVDFINMDVDAGRVIKAENKFIISLPRKLAEETKDAKGLFVVKNVNKLRTVMAHELGHITLHLGLLSRIESKTGSKELKGQFEQEANWFAAALLKLREERNKAIFGTK